MSSSKSSQSSAQTYTDNRMVLGEGSISANNGANVQVLDGGAIQAAFSLGKDALDANNTTTASAFGFGTKVLDASIKATDRALDNLQATQQLTADAYADAKGRGAMTDKLLIAAVIGAMGVAFMAVRSNS